MLSISKLNSISLIILLLYCGLLLQNCVSSPEEQTNTKVSPNDQLIFLGDAFTAGVQNKGWSETFQKMNYPQILAKQIRTTDFQQPLLSVPGNPACQILSESDDGTGLITPVLTDTQPTNTTLLNNVKFFHNLAIPGATEGDVILTTSATGIQSDYASKEIFGSTSFDFVLRGSNSATLDLAMSCITEGLTIGKRSIVFVWLGNTNILDAIYRGGPTTSPETPIPAEPNFSTNYKFLVNQLKSTPGIKYIVLFTIPDLDSFPYVTHIGNTIASKIASDSNPEGYILPKDMFISRDAAGTDIITRTAITEGAYIILYSPNQGFISQLLKSGAGKTKENPILDSYIIRVDEAYQIQRAINEYNDIIREVYSQQGSEMTVLVDTNAVFASVKSTGYDFGGMTLDSQYLTGGFFSLDGIYPSTLGNVVIANAVIKALEDKFGAKIPLANLKSYIK